MSVKSVTDAFAAAVRRSDETSGKCLIKPAIDAAAATKIAAAAGDFLDDAERKAIERVIKLSSLDEAGSSALAGALAKPKMTAVQRKPLIEAKRKELRETAGDVCGSVLAMIFLPGSCAVTIVGAATMTDAKVAKLID